MPWALFLLSRRRLMPDSVRERVGEIENGLVSAILEEGGDGPVLRGVAFVNRPYLKFLRPLEVVVRDGKELVRAQLARYGIYAHPDGPGGKLPFTSEFWSHVTQNWKGNVYGQKVFADKKHQPNEGSLGEMVSLEDTGDGVDGIFDPTEKGLEAVKGKDVNYASIDLVFNYSGNLISLAASETLDDVDLVSEVFVELAAEQAINQQEVGNMADKGKETPPAEGKETPPAINLEELKAELKSELNAEMQVQLDEEKATLKAAADALEAERGVFLAERTQQREDLRRQRVEVFLTGINQPDAKGMCHDEPIKVLARAILLGDPIKLGDDDGNVIQLTEEATLPLVHSYYREAIEVLLSAIPRVVPTGKRIEPKGMETPDQIAADQAKEARAERKHFMVMAKEQAKGGALLTEEDHAAIEEKLDRLFGPEEG
jgi:hypothetical protein